MDKKYSLNGIEFIERKKSFKPYRIKAILFSEKYNEFENKYCGDLQNEINNFLYTDKKVMGKVIAASNSGDVTKLNKVCQEVLLSEPNQIAKLTKLTERKSLARELFLYTDCKGNFSDENVKELCEIMFENADIINHEPQEENEFIEYSKFIDGVCSDFFLKYPKQIYIQKK